KTGNSNNISQYYFNFGFFLGKYSTCELEVFDLLLQSQKPMSAVEVAQKLGTSEDGVERLLDLLVAIDIVDVEVVQGTAFYSSTDVANLYLAKTSPKSLHDRDFLQKKYYSKISVCLYCFPDFYYAEIHGTTFDLSNFKTVRDLGELAKEDPSSTVTVLDLPAVVQTAQQHFTQQDDTICFQEGSNHIHAHLRHLLFNLGLVL
uniref:Acetylserotonin O-methyltransferase 2 n=1 Tax=Cyprinus carpio TaxID=7962 RepID=A0A8C1PM21_CYPCA